MRRRSATVDIADEIAASIYAEAGRRGWRLRGSRQALVERLRDLLRWGDRYVVELVALLLLDRDKWEFSAGRSLGWASVDWVRGAAGVPDGGWRWALWERNLQSGETRASVYYWRGVFSDAVAAGDGGEAARADAALQRLWDATAALEVSCPI